MTATTEAAIGSTSEEWHQRRRKCIGGSDAAAVLGLSPWRTPNDVWLDKIGVVSPPIENEWVRWGKLLEPVIMAEYTLRTGYTLLPRQWKIHKTYPFIGANLDAQIKGAERGVEVKTSISSTNWGPDGSDEIPLYYLAQVHHYLMVTGWKRWTVVALIGGSMFRTYEIEKDPEAEAMLLEEEVGFWTKHVLPRRPPPPDGYSKAYAQYLMGKVQKRAVCTENDAYLDGVLQDLFAAHLQRERAIEAFDRAKMAVIEAMSRAGADKLFNESGQALWGMRRGRRTTDWAAVVKEAGLPADLIEKHTSIGEPGDFFKVTHRLVEKEKGEDDHAGELGTVA